MSNKMLIDAAHPEETRVVVVRGKKLEDFDFESSSRKQLRGNIYLAKVTRVEASLQAAFVDYGGNRHGFLAFSEIHPDYYQIPVADREALLKEEAAYEIAAKSEESDDSNGRKRRGAKARDNGEDRNESDDDAEHDDDNSDIDADGNGRKAASNGADQGEDAGDGRDDNVESVGSEDALEEVPRRAQRRRNYKIQEVIKRRQVILVQVVKEERGKKGAALTTYLSLAGRHCVLMPNTARGGGISRKITNPADRRRLRDIANDLNVPDGMGLIVRTAGANRTKAEIKRDFDYLLRLWETVRDMTLSSSAPNLVYEEGSLIKRSIRDLYNKDIAEVQVEGEDAYKEAKGFMRMLMPSHAKNVKLYKSDRPIFIESGIESQLDAMFSPVVTLKSGGYIVINQTEALVAVDVNSGKSTREHNIEDTALNTNLEACDEVSRQLRLRDLAGLIVIDFIDMEQRRNNRAVERRLKERLKDDRARIQVGRVSPFGLLEMSRQRLRPGMLEGSTVICAQCDGRGFVRSVESAALHVLRAIEEHLNARGGESLMVSAPADVCLYILNQKRDRLVGMEQRFGVNLLLEQGHGLSDGKFEITTISDGDGGDGNAAGVRLDLVYNAAEQAEEEESQGKRRRRRGGKRRDRSDSDGDHDHKAAAADAQPASDETGASDDAQAKPAKDDDDGDAGGKSSRRRRGRRGGRRVQRRRQSREPDGAQAQDGEDHASGSDDGARPDHKGVDGDGGHDAGDDAGQAAAGTDANASGDIAETAAKPPAKRSRRKKAAPEQDDAAAPANQESDGEGAIAPKPARKRPRKRASGNGDDVAVSDQGGETPVPADEAKSDKEPAEAASEPVTSSEPEGPPRSGWWRRR